MRLIARIPGLLYILDPADQLFQVPTDGHAGSIVRHSRIESEALRNHAGFLERIGRQQCADEYHAAADAIEQLDAERFQPIAA